MKRVAYKITCNRETDSALGDDREVYYEPERLPAECLANLTEAGWKVSQKRILIREEVARLEATSDRNSEKSASLSGASSTAVGYALAAGLGDDAVRALRRIADGGKGTLLD